MKPATLYNSILLLITSICFFYSIAVAILGSWLQAIYFLLLALFVFLVFFNNKNYNNAEDQKRGGSH